MPETAAAPSPASTPVRRALVSVHDKTGVAEFARELVASGVRIVSTGGTAAHLKESGVEVSLVEELTGFPEILGGRVKTLHPKVFAGVLADDSRDDHARDLERQAIEAFDLVVVNLYPFEKTVAAGKTRAEIVEMIDVGGPAMIRAAAKNHKRVAVVADPADYAPVLEEIRATGGTSLPTRERLAARAFSRTAAYDAAIAGYFAATAERVAEFPEHLVFAFDRVGALRYGENPHQRAALYAFRSAPPDALVRFQMLQGKELSFNNLLDLDSAVALARDFDGPAAVIVKHNNPCGVGVGDTNSEAFGRAFACDPLAAFGGIIAIRGRVDGALAALVLQHFVEVVAADEFTEEALTFFGKKPNIRLLKVPVSRRSVGRTRLEADRGRPPPAGLRHRAGPDLRLEARVAAQTDRGRARGVRARLEGRAARQVERDRHRQRAADDRDRRRPDEPRRRLSPRGDQARSPDRQLRRRLGRLLSLPRRRGHPRRGRRHRHRRSGRLDPGSGDRGRGRRAGPRVPHRAAPPLPALTVCRPRES